MHATSSPYLYASNLLPQASPWSCSFVHLSSYCQDLASVIQPIDPYTMKESWCCVLASELAQTVGMCGIRESNMAFLPDPACIIPGSVPAGRGAHSGTEGGHRWSLARTRVQDRCITLTTSEETRLAVSSVRERTTASQQHVACSSASRRVKRLWYPIRADLHSCCNFSSELVD